MLICGGNGEDRADLAGEDGSRRRGHRAPAGFERWRSLTEDGSKGWMMDLKTGKGVGCAWLAGSDLGGSREGFGVAAAEKDGWDKSPKI